MVIVTIKQDDVNPCISNALCMEKLNQLAFDMFIKSLIDLQFLKNIWNALSLFKTTIQTLILCDACRRIMSKVMKSQL